MSDCTAYTAGKAARPKTELEAQVVLFANGRTVAEVRAELGV